MLEGFDLTGRVAIITGGGTGIGRATATLLAERGAEVVLAGRKAEPLEIAAETIRALGREVLAQPTDVRKPDHIQAMVDAAMARFGRIDILVNNAGGAHGHVSLAKIDLAKWDRDIQLNLSAAQYCAQAAIAHLRANGNGAIVNISSFAGIAGTVGAGAYSAAKAGLQMLTRVMAAEWGPRGVRVNCVAPGMTATEAAQKAWASGRYDPATIIDKFPLRRYGEMREIAQAIAFFASDASSYITGETLTVSGGPQIGGLISADDD